MEPRLGRRYDGRADEGWGELQLSTMTRTILLSMMVALAPSCGGSPAATPGPTASDVRPPEPEPEPKSPAKATTPSEAPAKAAGPRPPGPPSGSTDELPRLHGASKAVLLEEFGEPTTKREFTMGECCTEFEIELLNTYPKDGRHEAVEIHQWTWVYDDYSLTVWLHDTGWPGWEVLDTIRYLNDVEF